MKPYQPRRIEFVRVLEHGDWRIKAFTVDYRNADVALDPFKDAIAKALRELPTPAHTASRAGLGFLIAHRGDGIDYLVLAWWDRENEMPLRILVRPEGEDWRVAQGSESVCVWDLQVIGSERDA